MTRNRIILTAALTCLACAGMAAGQNNRPAKPGQSDSAAQKQDEKPVKDSAQVTGKEPKGDPYPLAECMVCGQALNAMGKPVVRSVDGREIRFCCSDCAKKFEADKAGHLARLDRRIIEQQKPHYPLKTCVVMAEDALDTPDEKTVDYVYKNRLVRFCCSECIKPFLKEPATYLAKIDAAVIAQQREAYPLDTCIVSGEKLGSMGEPVDRVYGVALVRFCCKGCIKSYENDPSASMAKLHKAWGKAHGHDGQDHDRGRHEGHDSPGQHKGHDKEGHPHHD
jgi:YHS domain-containing protein